MTRLPKNRYRAIPDTLVFAALLFASVFAAGSVGSKSIRNGPSRVLAERARIEGQPSHSPSDKVSGTRAGERPMRQTNSGSALTNAYSTLLLQAGGSFDLSRNVIAGGGSLSTGSSNLVLDGTMGQPGASTTMSSGQYAVAGGFWQPEAASTCQAIYSIGGKVIYRDSNTGVRNATLALSGSQSETTNTDGGGSYTLSNEQACGNYTVTPSKTGDVNGITAFDASLAARFAAHLISLTPNQQIAADASNNGSVSAFDASEIARTAANIANGGIAGSWKFSPANLNFNNLNADQADQSFTAVLIGDVSGNWTPAGPIRNGPESASVTTLAVALPDKQDPPGATSTIPIVVGDTTGLGVFAYDFDMTFNQAVLQPQATPFDATGTLSSSWSINANTSTPGHLVINAFNTNPMVGQGVLLYLKFQVVGGAGSTSPLMWTNFEFNEGNPDDADINGSFSTTGPTAAPARINGQILTQASQPVSGATVSVTGGPKTIRAITDSNGYYSVENLETGAFYNVIPSRANYVFAPPNRPLSLLADRTDVVFNASPVGPDANPLESPEFFVRQQYLDFLGREPDQAGLDYWAAQIRACVSNADCLSTRRIEVSAAFFIAQEFQDSGLFLYDLYQGALGRRPVYAEYSVDRKQIVGGPTLETEKTVFVGSFVEREEFLQRYPLTMTGDVFVDSLLQTAQQSSRVDLSSERPGLINLYTEGTNIVESRRLVVRRLIEGSSFKQAQYNSAFVLMEYFGYLGRNADDRGYQFWLNILNTDVTNDTSAYRTMVCAFVTSMEYQKRFSAVVTHSNQQCGP